MAGITEIMVAMLTTKYLFAGGGNFSSDRKGVSMDWMGGPVRTIIGTVRNHTAHFISYSSNVT